MRRHLEDPVNPIVYLCSLLFVAALCVTLIYVLNKPSYCERTGNTESIQPGFVYKAKVKVKDGFFKDHTGVILSQSYDTYRFAPGEYCYVPQYEVSLDEAGYYTTSQSNLELIK